MLVRIVPEHHLKFACLLAERFVAYSQLATFDYMTESMKVC